jgi:hypothetical protein
MQSIYMVQNCINSFPYIFYYCDAVASFVNFLLILCIYLIFLMYSTIANICQFRK